jgi:hypothetical protein
LQPKLDSEVEEKSVFWPLFLRFLIYCGPKYEKKANLRPKNQFGPLTKREKIKDDQLFKLSKRFFFNRNNILINE